MSGLEGLYQQIILEQAKARHGDGPLDHADAEHHEFNPTCGDELTMRIRLDDTHSRIAELAWQGDGCSISMASASTLVELAAGRDVDGVRELIDGFRTMLRSRPLTGHPRRRRIAARPRALRRSGRPRRRWCTRGRSPAWTP